MSASNADGMNIPSLAGIAARVEPADGCGSWEPLSGFNPDAIDEEKRPSA